MPSSQLVAFLRDQVRERIDLADSLSDAELTRAIEDTVLQWSRSHSLTSTEKYTLVRRIFSTFRGLDLLQPLLDDPGITEIMVNGADRIFIERNGELLRYPHAFESQERLEDIIQAVVAGVNRSVNESNPIVDARLKDGSRVHIVLPPVALQGPCMTIRKFPARPLLMEDLVRAGAITAEAAELLKLLVLGKYNIFISGGTGTGKTTLLNALSQYIPPHERVITIEDSAELQLHSLPNLIGLETRNANTEGRGRIAIKDLIRASLRMRPNRIIVGEVRGEEAIDMLQAMNTGHAGSLSTGHANSAADMASRLEMMVLGAVELPVAAIRQQIASAIDIFVHLSRMRDHSRKITEISEVAGIQDGAIMLNPLFLYEERAGIAGTTTADCAISDTGALTATGNVLRQQAKLASAGLAGRYEEVCYGKTERRQSGEMVQNA